MLLDTLEKDCRDWVSNFDEIPMNECDMQVQLSHYLIDTKHYDKVDVEYAVPLEMFHSVGFQVPEYKIVNKKRDWDKPENFPWHSQMYIDIVVKKGKQFAAVELKDSSASIIEKLDIFGEEVPDDLDILKDQAANNEVMYDYWKDVRRIEALTRFKNVVGGVALIVGNDSIYWTKSNRNPRYMPFSTYEEKGSVHKVGPGKLDWNYKPGDVTKKTSHPPFRLDGSYECKWGYTKIPAHAKKDKAPFRYMLLKIKK